ncbi:MAG: T9SS type A sorting domain-containing protein [Bacteroidales bacterium]
MIALTDINETSSADLSKTKISDAYPNPFVNETSISVVINEQSNASLIIYDMQGEQIKNID